MKINFPVINTNYYKRNDCFDKQNKSKNNQGKNIDVLGYLNNCSLSFQGRSPIPIYAIFKDGSYERFNSKYHASVKLGIHTSDVIRSTKEDSGNKKSIIFVDARKVEKKQEDGTVVVDKTKIQKQMQKFKSAIYAINKEGEFLKFETRKEAAETLKLDAPSITHCLQGKIKTVKGYSFVYANDIEKKDEFGNVYIPKQTMDSILTFIKSENEIYSILPDGTCKKFPSQVEALKYYNLSGNGISKCIKGETKTVHGMTFVRARDIEKYTEDGEMQIDEEKLAKILKKFKLPIYAIDENGNYIKFANRKEAEEALNIDGSSISTCLSGKVNKVGKYTFVKADEIEEKNTNGEVVISQEKIKKALMNFKSSIYAVDKKGNYILFKSRKEIEETLNIDGSSISHCLKGRVKSAGGYYFIRANEIDINENIEEQLKSKIEKILEKQKKSKVVAIFPDKTTKEYENARVAAKELSLDPSSIYKIINGEYKQTKGITFIRKIEEND